MQIERVIDKIRSASVDPHPVDNIYLEDVFDSFFYQEILENLPPDEAYDYIPHPDARLPDGTSTRRILTIGADTLARFDSATHGFWENFLQELTSSEIITCITQKFSTTINACFGPEWPPLVAVPVLYRDYPGYRIGIHPDAEFKVATLQFYLPSDNTQLHLGTSFHIKRGDEFVHWKTNRFFPNSAYAFPRTAASWHSVSQIAEAERPRNTLALTIYLQGSPYFKTKLL
jgi:hypothetical protein